MTGASVAILPDEEIAPWRPYLHWFLGIPHLLFTAVLAVASAVTALLSAGWVVLTGRVPARLVEFEVYAVRERVRAYSHFFVLRASYPPFPRQVTALEPGDDPQTHVSAVGPVRVPRWSPIVRLLVVLPHVLVLAPVGLVLDLLYPAWMIAAAVNGGWPDGMRRFLVRVEEWVAELMLYIFMATDKAPRFGFGSEMVVSRPALVVAGRGVTVGVSVAPSPGLPAGQAAPSAR